MALLVQEIKPEAFNHFLQIIKLSTHPLAARNKHFVSKTRGIEAQTRNYKVIFFNFFWINQILFVIQKKRRRLHNQILQPTTLSPIYLTQ